jgi:hypothetical protein
MAWASAEDVITGCFWKIFCISGRQAVLRWEPDWNRFLYGGKHLKTEAEITTSAEVEISGPSWPLEPV